MLLVVACGVVWRRPEGSSDTTTTSEGLVVETQVCDGCSPCSPATDNFVGISSTNAVFPRFAQGTPFQTVNQLGRRGQILRWLNSWYMESSILSLEERMVRMSRPVGTGWTVIDQRNMRYVHPLSARPRITLYVRVVHHRLHVRRRRTVSRRVPI